MRDALIAGGWVLAAILLTVLACVAAGSWNPPSLPPEAQPEDAPEPEAVPWYLAAPTGPEDPPWPSADQPAEVMPTAAKPPWAAGVDCNTTWRKRQGLEVAAAVRAARKQGETA